MVHTLFSIVAPIVNGRPVEVREADLAFGDMPALHFASVVMFDRPAGARDGEFPAHVVLEVCADGTTDDALAALLVGRQRRLAVHDLFANCEGFDEVAGSVPGSDEHERALARYLHRYVVRPQLFHIGCPAMRLPQIEAGSALYDALDDSIRRLGPAALSRQCPPKVVDELRRALRVPASWRTHWHLDPATVPAREYAWFSDVVRRWPSRLRHWGKLLLAIVLLLGIGVGLWRLGGASAVAAALAAGYLLFRVYWRWLTGRHPPSELDPGALRALTEQEDTGIHNHMASLALLKPGRLRRIAIRAVLHGFNLIYRTWYTDVTPGRLQGLPTIHFAQWSLVPLPTGRNGERREALLFLSNYDGSWESYLDDFLAFLFRGVVMIWGNAVTFPSPVDARSFKHWARTQMTPHRAWHEAVYRTLTVANIQNNSQLRMGLLRPPLLEHGARLWLARLGSIKTGNEQFDDAVGELPADDMQGLLLRGYGGLPYAVFAVLHLCDGAAGRRWLQGLVGSITDGRALDRRDRAAESEAVNVAFTHRGLEILGLPAPVLERFPLVFREGVAPVDTNGRALQHRSRVLGDSGRSAPENWTWGGRNGRDREAHVLLMMYGRTRETVDRLSRTARQAFDAAGAGREVAIIASEPIGETSDVAIEHFGFADGLSQPRIEGTWQVGREAIDAAVRDVVKPGEFILGYEANDGSMTPGVPVEAAFDPDGLLPPADEGMAAKDFGRNGTFLVARQLSQDVAAFRRFTAEAAGVPASQHASRAAERVAACIVGRTRSGVPLVESSESGDPNAFTFSADPHGFGCPIGAHIRRANPRDSLGIDPAAAQMAANRHRLLRRGRPYGPPLPIGDTDARDGARGMMFVCLNADIERQFEFVQQNWINSPVFGGLYAERDPLVGAMEPPARFTVQANAISTRMAGLARFVDMVGGGYFFMPGISALRYLAQLEPVARALTPASAALTTAAPREPSALAEALTTLAGVLARLRLLWAVRFPVLVAAALVLLPVAAAWAPLMSLPLFLTTSAGAVSIGLMASLAAWTVMVTLRLVLMYGTRVGLSRPRWTASATWRQVIGFQLLALPVVVGAIHFSARDAAGAGGAYGEIATRLSLASGAGLALGMLALVLATTVQSLRRGGRPDLFLPPIGVLQPLIARLQRSRGARWASRRIGIVSARFVSRVPPEIGAGYINDRERRLLPGHAFAAVLLAVVLAVYAAGFFLLNPARSAAASAVPAIAYVLFLLLAAGWLLAAVAFFLDRYRIPTLLTVVIWLVAVATLGRPDHVFEVGGPIEPGALPSEIAAAAQLARPGRAVIVASEGYGLAASAWTAEVLTRLAEGEHGQRFGDAVRLISASSGAALGTTHFAEAFTPAGFAGRHPDALQRIRERSRTPSSSDGWWGLVYPDLLRAFVPALVPAPADRGWAMEQAWRRTFAGGRGTTLSAWRRDVAAGWRPAMVFGVTSVESGEQGLLATYRVRTRHPDGPDHVTRGRDVAVVTAARLSASFPYVSPAARAQAGDPAAHHFTDGGFWDNSGLLAALDWIEDAGHDAGSVLLVEVRTSPRRRPRAAESRLWVLEAFGPLRTLVEVRYDGQRVRNAATLTRFMDAHPLEHAVFELDDPRVPLTWNLGRADVSCIEAAWSRGDNRRQADRVRAFLASE